MTAADARVRVATLVAEWEAAHPLRPDEMRPALNHTAYGRIPLDALKTSPELQQLRAFLTSPIT